jgi:phosphoglycerol transferase
MSSTPDLKASAGAPLAPPQTGERPRAPAMMARVRRQLPALAVLAALFAWLTIRALGLMPTIFADEWYYSRLARLQPLSEAVLPSYLYLALFRATSLCGEGYLDCARGMNALLFVGAAPFVYLTARAFTGRATAAVLALLATLAPLDIYVSYFMPEPMYYFGFSVLSWVALTRRDWHWAMHALVCGTLLGLMCLVKVHAVFLVPALCLFLLYTRWLAGPGWFLPGVASMALGATAFVAVRFGIGYLLAGRPALDLFGPFYGGGAHMAGRRSLLDLLQPASISLRGHLMLLAVLSALPLAILAEFILRPPARADASESSLLRAYTLLFLGAAAGLTVFYTALLAAPDSLEGFRLHLRYYSFVFPTLWLVAAPSDADLPRPHAHSAALRWIVAAVLLALLAWAWMRLPTFSINSVDTPEGAAVPLDNSIGRCLALLQAAILLMWAGGRMSARKLFLFGALPLLAAAGIVNNRHFLANFRAQGLGDRAGLFAHRTIPVDERDQVTVLGTGPEQHMRAQFHIGSAHTTTLEVQPDTPVEAYQLPIRNKWLLVIGNHALPPGVLPVAPTEGFALIHLPHNNRILARARLTEPFGPQGLIAAAEGLSQPEAFGRWSDGKRIVLHLNTTLPRRLNLVIKGWSFADNANRLFYVHVGDSTAAFRIGITEEDSGVRMETDGTQRDIVIDVPHPQSPEELGTPGDPRKLGLALEEIEISTPAAP